MKESPPPVAVGQVIDGKYRVERVIGSGGMGVVVAAQHLGLGKIVALKFLLKQACENREAVSRFLREGQALARITSDHVARVMDVGTLEQGEPYLVMEYLEGSDFGAVLKRRGPLPLIDAAAYLLQACEAIAEAHANGIIHRDLKPSNLFLTRGADGVPLVKVLDFGISKAITQRAEELVVHAGPNEVTAGVAHDTNTGALVGSPLYMSPEQIRNARRVDERTDVWSLGVILHELVAGSPPFEGETLSGTLASVAADPPRSLKASAPDVPAEFEAVVLRCLQKSPDRRYQSIASLAQALRPFAPPEARASVERISRLLNVSSRSSEDSDETTSEPVGEAGPTVPSWEGDTALMGTLTPWVKKRASLLIAAGLSVAAAAGVFLFTRLATPERAVPAAPGPGFSAVVSPGVEAGASQPSAMLPAAAAAPAPAPAPSPSASASAAAVPVPTPEPSQRARLPRPSAGSTKRGPVSANAPSANERPAEPRKEQDGTADRK